MELALKLECVPCHPLVGDSCRKFHEKFYALKLLAIWGISSHKPELGNCLDALQTESQKFPRLKERSLPFR